MRVGLLGLVVCLVALGLVSGVAAMGGGGIDGDTDPLSVVSDSAGVSATGSDWDGDVPAESERDWATELSFEGQNPTDVTLAGPFESEGTVELVVALDGDTSDHVQAVAQGGQVEDDNAQTARSALTPGQANLESFASETAGVTVENTFWITDAAVVSVDTDRVAPETLATVAGVEAVIDGPLAEQQSAADATASTGDTAVAADTEATAGETEEMADETTYGLEQIRAAEAWATHNTTGEGASVAVLDTGIDVSHPDLSLAEDGWADFYSNGTQRDTDPMDYDPRGHGTHVSGTVAGGNTSGTHIGVAPGVDLYHGAVLNDCEQGGCTGSGQVFAGIEWAVENDIDIVSMSLGSTGSNFLYIDPITNAHEAGTTVVASSGNDGETNSSSPGNVYDSIAVGASNEFEDIRFSSSGEVVQRSDWLNPPDSWPEEWVVPTIAAPGDSVWSAMPGNDYDTKSGTSMAAPHVSGALALAESATERDISAENAETALEATAWKPDDWDGEPAGERDTRYGSGIIDAPDLIDLLQEIPDSSLDAPGEATLGENVTLNATATTGTNLTYRWDLTGDGVVDTETSNATLVHTFDRDGTHNVTLEVVDGNGLVDQTTATVSVASEVEPISDEFETPTAPNEEGVYEDVTGDGNVTVVDVQALFDNLDSEEVQANAWAFDFTGTNAETVTIFDVQTLFNRTR